MEMTEVIVGTYEEFLLGYKLTADKNGKHSLTMSFTNHSQSKSIRAVSKIGKFVASGSADESINLINMSARVEHGSLQEQSGTITCLTEYEGKYLFSGCDDGTLCIWKKGSWLCEKTLKAHTGGVIDVSVHPSGKLALSIGKDKALKTWNLVKGRCGYVTNLKVVADAVRWSPNGDHYAVSLSNRIDVYSVETAKVVYSAPAGKRIYCLAFSNDTTILIGGDKESVEVHDIKLEKKLTDFKCHKVRVKAIEFVPEFQLLFTASNDGFIKVWKFEENDFSNPPTLLCELDTTCRITCMTIWTKDGTQEDEEATEDMEVEEDEVIDEEDDSADDEEEVDGAVGGNSSDDSSSNEEGKFRTKKRLKLDKAGFNKQNKNRTKETVPAPPKAGKRKRKN